MKLADRVAIVTGGGQTKGEAIGNGRATAMCFAEHGAKVLVTDRNLESATETVAAIEKNGGVAAAFAMDVSNQDNCQAMVEECIKRFGRVDILHNNVGIGFKDGDVTKIALEDWQRMFDVNLTSMMLTSKFVLPIMREQASGVIINVSSLAAVANTPMSAYKISKAGVNALTEHLAITNAKYGIRVNGILPGLIHTPMAVAGYSHILNKPQSEIIEARNRQVPLGRKMGSSTDIALAALFLASDDAAFITGVNLPVDGGQRLRVG